MILNKWCLIYFDDIKENIDALSAVLSEKFQVIGTHDPKEYSRYLNRYHPQAILIDINMPEIDGFDLFQKILRHPDYTGCPVFFISGDVCGETKIRTHTSGAVDFISRLLKPEEITARIENKIKIHQQKALKLHLGNLMINFQELRVIIDEEEIDLTLLEMRILGILMRNYPNHVHIPDLIRDIWGSNEPVKSGTIKTHITTFRPKLEDWNYVIKTKSQKLYVQLKNQ